MFWAQRQSGERCTPTRVSEASELWGALFSSYTESISEVTLEKEQSAGSGMWSASPLPKLEAAAGQITLARRNGELEIEPNNLNYTSAYGLV